MKNILMALVVVWGFFVAVASVTNPVWERGAGQMIGAAAMVGLALYAAMRLTQQFSARRNGEL